MEEVKGKGCVSVMEHSDAPFEQEAGGDHTLVKFNGNWRQ